MPMSTPQNSSHHDAGPAADRLTDLELLFMHLERQVAELNQIVLKHGEQIERLQRDLQRLKRAAERPDESGPESDGPSWGE